MIVLYPLFLAALEIMSKIRVVLVEDHNLTRVGLKAAIEQEDDLTLVGEAASGIQGLSLLKEMVPDVAVVDIGLPDLDGIELTQQFKAFMQEMPEAATKVLILTMHDDEKAVMASFAAGADSYCIKDVELSRLMSAIRETSEGHSWIDPAIANLVLRQVRQEPAATAPEDPGRTIEIEAVSPEYEQILETYPLTQREREILELIVAGCSNAAIADKLFVTVGTVKTHVRNILNKLGASDRTQAAVRALRSGLVN